MIMVKLVVLIVEDIGCVKRLMGNIDVRSVIGFPKIMIIVQ